MEKQPTRYDDRRDAFLDLDAWAKSGPFKLERAEGSSAHRFRTAWEEGNALWLEAPLDSLVVFKPHPGNRHVNVFVVQHDWAAAFKDAQDFDGGDFQLPYDEVEFEFRISGKRSFALVTNNFDEADGKKTITLFVECGRHWVLPISPFILLNGEWEPTEVDDENPLKDLPKFLATQVKAVCVSLEAEVAVGEKVEVPAKLNAARVRRGQQPLAEYNVVRLNRKPRSVHIAGDGTHTKKRLHFRRGHRRKLSEEKTVWVRWCLVGDPDLGFIDKEYRL